MAGIKKENFGEFFVGQGDIIHFDSISDYSAKTLADLVNGKSFGNIKEGSTNWTGEEMTDTIVKNEQGNVVVTTTTAGTLSFEATLLDFENAIIKKLLKATDITVSTLSPDWLEAAGSATALGFGVELPVVEMPVGIANDTLNKTLIFPKAKVASAIVLEDKVIGIKISVKAQSINTATLKTGMIVKGALQYSTGV